MVYLTLEEMAEEFVTQIIESGRITIPLAIRELFKLKEGDYVRIAFVKKLSTTGA